MPLGVYAQTLMETLYPNALASLAKEVSEDAHEFVDAGLAEVACLPETGTLDASFGKKVDVNQLAALSPDLILQAGIPREGTAEKLNRIQIESDIPCIFVDVSFGKLQNAYRTLGSLLDCEQRAKELVCYIDDAQQKAFERMKSVRSEMRVFYGPRAAGKKVTDGVVIQIDAIASLGLSPITSPYNFECRGIDFDALIEEAPDFVLLDDTSFPASFVSGEGEVYESWRGIDAISEGRFAVAPALMHNILGSAIFVQSIGMLWIAWVIAPYHFGYDMASEMSAFYRLFNGLDRDAWSMSRLLGEEPINE